jgi:hypothetical protein
LINNGRSTTDGTRIKVETVRILLHGKSSNGIGAGESDMESKPINTLAERSSMDSANTEDMKKEGDIPLISAIVVLPICCAMFPGTYLAIWVKPIMALSWVGFQWLSMLRSKIDQANPAKGTNKALRSAAQKIARRQSILSSAVRSCVLNVLKAKNRK